MTSQPTIWKYEVEVDDEVSVDMPASAKILSIGSQKPGYLCFWAITNPGLAMVKRSFLIRRTGNPLEGANPALFIGTVSGGPSVWHVFEKR